MVVRGMVDGVVYAVYAVAELSWVGVKQGKEKGGSSKQH